MRIALITTVLVYLSVAATGARVDIPGIQRIEISTPLYITAGINKELCEKYNHLFMEALHESLECSEDYGPPPYLEEKCEEIRRRLSDYSRLRSLYCYGEHEETC